MPNESNANDAAPQADDSNNESPTNPPPIPRWLFSMIGHLCAALIGLGLGYLILNWLRPEKFPLPW